MAKPEMTDAETAAHLRRYVAGEVKGFSEFSWPTDACGERQHMRFVKHRNRNWHGTLEQWNAFVLAYADSLEAPAAQPGDQGERP